MSWENQTFRKAAQSAGITGKDLRGNNAIRAFSNYLHSEYPKWEREQLGFNGIREIAIDWWEEHRSEYAGPNTFKEDEAFES